MAIAMQATGRRPHTTVTDKNPAAKLDFDHLGRGILLIGSLGIEECSSGAECVKEVLKQGYPAQLSQLRYGFGNLSELG